MMHWKCWLLPHKFVAFDRKGPPFVVGLKCARCEKIFAIASPPDDDRVRELALEVTRLRKALSEASHPLIMDAGETHTAYIEKSEPNGSVEVGADGRVLVRQPWWLYERLRDGDAVRVLQGPPARWFINGAEHFPPESNEHTP